MVKLLKYTIIITCLLLAMILGTANWVLYSPAGTAWLLRELPDWTDTEFTIGQIEGTLGKTLQLKNIELHQKELQLSLDHFSIQNQLTGFFPPVLEIKQLHAENLQIKSSEQQNSPPISFNWPKLPWLLDLLQINLNNISLQNISWQQQNQPPLQIELFHGDLHWQNGSLQSKNFRLQSGILRANGSFNCGLKQPALKVDLQIKTVDSTSVWKTLRLQADLGEGSGQQILHGSIELDFTVAEGDRLTAVSELELTSKQLRLRQLKLQRPDHPGIITADAMLNFGGTSLELNSTLQLEQIDLEEETGQPVNLSGTIQFEGNLEEYSGKFNLKNLGTGLADAQLTGSYTGTTDHFSLEKLRGKWLNGVLGGQAQIGWEQGWQLSTQLSGREIDPQKLYPQLAGRLNLDLQADFNGDGGQSPQGTLQLQLHDSILHNYPLSGVAKLYLQDNVLQIDQLQLQGEGIQLQVSGNPEEKLLYSWQVKDLQHLLANTSGQFSGNGWLSWQQQSLRVALQASGENLTFEDWQLDRLFLQVKTPENEIMWQLQLDGQSLHNQQLDLDIEKISIGLEGDLDNHQLTLNLTRQLSLASAKIRGSWDGHQWQGELSSAQVTGSPLGNWYLLQATPILLSAEQLNLELLSLYSDHGSKLQLQGNYFLKQQQGTARIHWQDLDLSLIDPLLPDWLISGQSDGFIDLKRGDKNALHAEITANGEVQYQQLALQLDHSKILFNWDESGLQSSLQITLTNNSNLKGTLTSPQKNNFSWPQQGIIQLSGENIPLNIVRPWLAEELDLNGTLDLNSSGKWQTDEPLDLNGVAKINNGYLHWQEEERTNSVEIDSAELNWQWHENLKGKLNLKLWNHGDIETIFNLPLTAELPLAFDPDGDINVDLHAETYELGLLSIYFPQYFQKSRAQIKLDLHLTGSWQKPNLTGDFHLFDAKMFLPPAGIQLSGIELQGSVAGNHIELVKLQCKSGAGTLKGTGNLEIQNWLPSTYHLQLQGDNFQLLHLLELQVIASPDLTIDGTGESIKIRGQVMLPDLQINDQQATETIVNSQDLVIIDNPVQTHSSKKLKYDIDVLLLLGERVFLRTTQVDARLGGSLRVQSTEKQELVGYGKIYVIRGIYLGLGSNLNIDYGDIYFTGGPLDQPELDVLALRRISIVEVGVKITGTPQLPDIELYSIPIMPEGDILSYLVTGQSMSADRSQTNLIVSAASVLFPPGKSQGLIHRLGLDTFYISSDYEEGDGEDPATVITTGKYLSPDLYLSFGYSPDSNADQVKARYRLTPVWEIETTIGYDAGADIFYRIEFD